MGAMPITTCRWARITGVLLSVALLAAACGTSDAEREEGADVADAVIAAVDAAQGTAAPPTTLREGCRIVQTEDEYGFPVDVEVCDEDPDATLPPVGEMTFSDWAGGADAEAVAALLRDALVINGGCGDDELQHALEVAVAGVPEAVRAPLEDAAAELAQAAVFCETDPQRWAEHLGNAIAAVEEFVRVADAARLAAREGADDE